MPTKVLLTGASGLLGRAVFDRLISSGYEVPGWVGKRVNNPSWESVDLADSDAVAAALLRFEPSAIVHSAAIRRPDEIKDDVTLAHKVNVGATLQLAAHAAAHNIPMIYISTDYVFDGKSPPYNEDDGTSPVNEYGLQKVQGEKAVLETAKENGIILRVPIMYGKCEYLGEGAVDEVAKNILAAPKGAPLKLDHYHRRYPLNTADAAATLCLLLDARMKKGSAGVVGIYHWAGDECLTKYDMAMQIAKFPEFWLQTSVHGAIVTHWCDFVDSSPKRNSSHLLSIHVTRYVTVPQDNAMHLASDGDLCHALHVLPVYAAQTIPNCIHDQGDALLMVPIWQAANKCIVCRVALAPNRTSFSVHDSALHMRCADVKPQY